MDIKKTVQMGGFQKILYHIYSGFIKNGHIVLKNDVEDIRFNQGKSVDVLFREVFKC